MIFEGKSILVTGGTGSMGKVLVRRILSGKMGTPRKVIVLSRDEAKQHAMRLEFLHKRVTTDEVIYQNFKSTLEFRIGDVRTDDLAEVFEQSELARMMRRPQDYGICDDCGNVETCGAGCRAAAYAFGGRPDALDPSCPVRRAREPEPLYDNRRAAQTAASCETA